MKQPSRGQQLSTLTPFLRSQIANQTINNKLHTEEIVTAGISVMLSGYLRATSEAQKHCPFL